MFVLSHRVITSSNRIIWTAALLSLFILAACGSPAPAAVEPAQMEESAVESEMAAEEAKTEESAAETDAAETDNMDDSAMSETHTMTGTVEGDSETDGEMAETEVGEEVANEEGATDEEMAAVELPAWQQLALTDVRSGEPFTFADFSGKTVFVEPMATWCGNCRRQLTNVQEASAQLGDDVVFVALSVETNIAGEELATYADNAGFDYTFAVMTPEMLGELAGAFGQTISNPPATPHFIILPDGSTTELVTGIEPAADLVAQLEAARG